MNEQLVEEIEKLQTEDSTTTVAVQDTHKPEDVAAAFFKLNSNKLELLLDKLSAKQLRRVIFNACAYPFVDVKYNPRTDEERQTAYVVHEMMLNKTIMQLSYEMQLAENVSTNLESEGEVSNG